MTRIAEAVDTFVIDVDDIGEEQTMQARADSDQWHRLAFGTGGTKTACGIDLGHPSMRGGSMRREQLRGNLCPACFTLFEVQLAAANNEADRKGTE